MILHIISFPWINNKYNYTIHCQNENIIVDCCIFFVLYFRVVIILSRSMVFCHERKHFCLLNIREIYVLLYGFTLR